MSDPKEDDTMPGMPEQPTTVKLDKDEITRQLLDKVLLKLTEVGDSQAQTTQGMFTLAGKVDVLGGKVDTVSNDVHTIKAEQTEMREWKGAVEERFNSHSMRAKQESVHDSTQDTKLQELENRLAAQADSSMRAILAETARAAKTPLGQKVVKAGGYMLLALFGCATVYFGVLTARLQAQPQAAPTVVQVVPVTVYADAGAQ